MFRTARAIGEAIATVATALAVMTTAAPAQYTTQRFGGMTFTSGPNGYNATEQRFGGMTFGSDSAGNNWNQQTFGGTTFTNGSGPAFDTGNDGW